MRRWIKISLISLFSFLAVVVIAVAVTLHILMPPERLTPLVNEQLTKVIDMDLHLGSAELTLCSQWPLVSVEVREVSLSDRLTNDTLATLGVLTATVDVKQLLFDQVVEITGVQVHDGQVAVRVDADGRTNYDLLLSNSPDTTATTEPFVIPFLVMGLDRLSVEQLHVSYNDKQAQMAAEATLHDLNLVAAVSLDSMVAEAELGAKLEVHSFADSAGVLVEDAILRLHLPLEAQLDSRLLSIRQGRMAINDCWIDLSGTAQMGLADDYVLDLDVRTNEWDIAQLKAMVPDAYSDMLTDFAQLDGRLMLDAQIDGTYSPTQMPLMQGGIRLKNATIEHSAFPYVCEAIQGDVSATINLNDTTGFSSVRVKQFTAQVLDNTIAVQGQIDDVLGDMQCDLALQTDLNLDDFAAMLPADLEMQVKGKMKADVQADFALDDLMNLNLERVKAHGRVDYAQLDVDYDSILVDAHSGVVTFQMPSKSVGRILDLRLEADDVRFEMIDILGAELCKPAVQLSVGNVLDTTRVPWISAEIMAQAISLEQDSLVCSVVNPDLRVYNSKGKGSDKKSVLNLAYKSGCTAVEMPDVLDFDLSILELSAAIAYDKDIENTLLKWKPDVDVYLGGGQLQWGDLSEIIFIPTIECGLTPDDINIMQSHIRIGESDFALNGVIYNWAEFIANDGMLYGDLNYFSAQTNVDEIMDLVEEMTVTDELSDASEVSVVAPDSLAEAQPFMVPKGMDIAFTTYIANAIFNSEDIRNISGKLTVNDGKLVLEQMGFTSDAAEMLLTAVYRPDRVNHLYTGFNFHLLDVDIAKLIDLIPMIDSVVPMLNEFEGKAEFHLAGETYLNRNYEPKISTLRAAAAIEGHDLVLLDNKTFAQMSKLLMFKNKERNLVDSLSVEATVFKDEIDLYPFLLTMDRWQAVIAGRHNLDMNFNYHVSLTDCPLPVRLGLDVKGNFDDMKYDLVPCKYKRLYKPEKQGQTEKRVLELKKIIADALKTNVDKIKANSH